MSGKRGVDVRKELVRLADYVNEARRNLQLLQALMREMDNDLELVEAKVERVGDDADGDNEREMKEREIEAIEKADIFEKMLEAREIVDEHASRLYRHMDAAEKALYGAFEPPAKLQRLSP